MPARKKSGTKNAETGFDVSKFILNCLPSPHQEKDWGIVTARTACAYAAAAAAPPKKDLREENWWGVGSQGCTGSCVGWGVADGVLRWHFVKAGRLGKNEPLSVRFIWMASKETDEDTSRPTSFIEQAGTWLKAALDIARIYGAVTAKYLPFENDPGQPELFLSPIPNDPDPINTFYALAAQLRISSYYNLGKNPVDWRAWIANHGPVLTRLSVDATWDHATDSHGNLDEYKADTQRGGHCVSIVGYTPDRFIVRNSWGKSWGDNGYGYASEKYAAAAFTEAYGVII